MATPDSSTDDIERRKTKLKEIVRVHGDDVTLINARYIASLMHVSIAVSRSLLNQRSGQQAMKTTSLGNEVLYHMYPTHSVRPFL